MTNFNFKLIIKLLIALSLFVSILNSIPVDAIAKINQDQVFNSSLNDSLSFEVVTKSPYAISFLHDSNVYDTSNSSSTHLNLTEIEQRMQKFIFMPTQLNSSLNTKTLFDDSNNTIPKHMRQTFLYKYFNTTNSPKSSLKLTTNTTFTASNDTKNENVTAQISGNGINSTLVSPNLTLERMDSYLHLVPQMFYFFMNESKMFYLDYIPDENMIEMDRKEMELVQNLV